MKILIIGPLGAGKSSLAYQINKKFGLPRLNLDEVQRKPDNGYYSEAEQFDKLKDFVSYNQSWVCEGCQKYLYERVQPDLIVDMRINVLLSVLRFTTRFFKAKKLIGKTIAKDLPVQAYHYRKPTIKKIFEWAMASFEINQEIRRYLKTSITKTITCKSFGDYDKVFLEVAKEK